MENGKTAKLKWTVPDDLKEKELSVYIWQTKIISLLQEKDPIITPAAKNRFGERLSAMKLEANTGVVVIITKVKSSDEATFDLVALISRNNEKDLGKVKLDVSGKFQL